MPHLTWDDKPLAENEGVFFELAGCYRRYHCPLARTVYLGEPPKKWRRAEAALQEVLQDGLHAAHPGRFAAMWQGRRMRRLLAMALRKAAVAVIPLVWVIRRIGARKHELSSRRRN